MNCGLKGSHIESNTQPTRLVIIHHIINAYCHYTLQSTINTVISCMIMTLQLDKIF